MRLVAGKLSGVTFVNQFLQWFIAGMIALP
jgi:hypothetical protein